MKKRHQSYIVTFCSGSGSSGSSTSICSTYDPAVASAGGGGDDTQKSTIMDRKQDSSTDLLLVDNAQQASISQQNEAGERIGMGENATNSVARIREKFRGCLLGALVGDCVGSLFERDYSVSYTLLQDLYHSLTNLSEDEKLMDLHGIEMTLGPKRIREILDTKRQSCAQVRTAEDVGGTQEFGSRLKPQGPEGVQHLRRNSALASGTPTTIPCLSSNNSRRGSTSRPIEKYSDDTVQTKSVLYSLIACKGFDARHMAKQMTEDYFLNMNRKFGGYIRDIFVQLRENGYQDPFSPAKKCSAGIGAQGNEAASRVSPVALFCAWALQENPHQILVELAGKQAKITNAQRTGVHGAVLQALAIHTAFNWELQAGKCRACGGENATEDASPGGGLSPSTAGNNSPSSSSRHTSPLLMRRRGSLAITSARNSLGEVQLSGPRIMVEQQPKFFCEQLLERMSCSVEGRASLLENLKHLVQNSVGASKELLKPAEQTYCDKLRTVLEFLQRSQPPTRIEVVERLGNGFKALDSVPTAVYSFLFAAKNDMLPEMTTPIKSPILRTIFHAISFGGETDTLASMAGAIAGAYWGSTHIPPEILRVCEGSQEIVKLADELFNVILKNKIMTSSRGANVCQSCHQPVSGK